MSFLSKLYEFDRPRLLLFFKNLPLYENIVHNHIMSSVDIGKYNNAGTFFAKKIIFLVLEGLISKSQDIQ